MNLYQGEVQEIDNEIPHGGRFYAAFPTKDDSGKAGEGVLGVFSFPQHFSDIFETPRAREIGLNCHKVVAFDTKVTILAEESQISDHNILKALWINSKAPKKNYVHIFFWFMMAFY